MFSLYFTDPAAVSLLNIDLKALTLRMNRSICLIVVTPHKLAAAFSSICTFSCSSLSFAVNVGCVKEQVSIFRGTTEYTVLKRLAKK